MPRILCLHGMGTNARIFESQTAAFRNLLSEDYIFTFLDAPIACDAAPGLSQLYPGPYRCWYKTPTTASINKVHKLITAVLEASGPFDAIMGFSQGAAVAASYLLHDQISRPPTTAPIFKAAILISSPLPFSHSLDHGIDTRTYFGISPSPPLTRHSRPVRTTVPPHLKTNPAYLRGVDELKEFPEKEIYYQMFHPESDEVRIKVPTAHVFGRRDVWYRHCLDVVGLSDGAGRVVLEHGGGHEVPWGNGEEEEVCGVVEEVMARI